jgi:hypothetical protein
MFCKRKKDGKLKGRFCANAKGDIVYSTDDVSSPTVSTEAIFLTAAIDALERRKVATGDVEGAFLHADMTAEVYVWICAELAQLLVAYKPEIYKKYLTPDGRLLVRLNKALYGCVESAKLFYDHVSSTLMEAGFDRNAYDICVFNKITPYDGKQCTVTIHVDDLKISCADQRGVDDAIKVLENKYKKLNVNRSKVLDYLGMEFDYSQEGVCKISMKSMIADMLEECKTEGIVATPATADLYKITEKSELLDENGKKIFHSRVAKLLYLAKRGRPDLLTSVSFLTTRVTAPTREDDKKLDRVLKYLNGSKELLLTLSADGSMIVQASIDASFAVHYDGKGQTGAVISIGAGAVFAKSTKQKLVAKSSTESELIGLTDGLTQVIWTRNFLMEQGYHQQPAEIDQDNKSTIILSEKGRSTSARTRHVAMRYFLAKDYIERKEIKINYKSTLEMVADYLTKPLQGSLFIKHRAALMNIPQEVRI